MNNTYSNGVTTGITVGVVLAFTVTKCSELNPQEAEKFHQEMALAKSLQLAVSQKTALMCSKIFGDMVWDKNTNTLYYINNKSNIGYEKSQKVATLLSKETGILQNSIDKDQAWNDLKTNQDCK